MTPPWYVPESPTIITGHGGNCACPACIGVTYCGSPFGSTLLTSLTFAPLH
jgi:hypothetical protein